MYFRRNDNTGHVELIIQSFITIISFVLKDSAYCTLNQYFKMVAGNLRIMGLMPTDSGYYQCVGENSVGKVFGTAQLIIVDEGMYLV